MTDEWGPWVEHDGMGCPVRGGTPVQAEIAYRVDKIVIRNGISSENGESWFWRWMDLPYGRFPVCRDIFAAPIIRYRIRRPRALLELIDLVENLPAPAPEAVEA